jgi:PIN domain nuclease of toxin-antitoxin system
MLVLDTHALVWIMSDNPSLGLQSKVVIASAFADSAIAVSAMSFWETTMLSDRGRITIHEDASSWRQKVLRLGISEIPISGDIAIAAARLTEFHGDPADRLIAATAIVNGATLVTADRRILKWRSPLPRIDASR